MHPGPCPPRRHRTEYTGEVPQQRTKDGSENDRHRRRDGSETDDEKKDGDKARLEALPAESDHQPAGGHEQHSRDDCQHGAPAPSILEARATQRETRRCASGLEGGYESGNDGGAHTQ